MKFLGILLLIALTYFAYRANNPSKKEELKDLVKNLDIDKHKKNDTD